MYVYYLTAYIIVCQKISFSHFFILKFLYWYTQIQNYCVLVHWTFFSFIYYFTFSLFPFFIFLVNVFLIIAFLYSILFIYFSVLQVNFINTIKYIFNWLLLQISTFTTSWSMQESLEYLWLHLFPSWLTCFCWHKFCVCVCVCVLKTPKLILLGGSVVKNLPANAGDTDSIPVPGRSHMPRSS